MADKGTTPPAGGNLKYIIGGVLLLGAAVGLWMLLQLPAPAPAVDNDRKPKNAKRINPMAQQDLVLEEEKDAGKPAEPTEVAAEPVKKPHGPRRDEWDCQGDLSRTALQSVIDSNRAQIRNCYERRLKVNNILQGDLKLKLKIGATGQMSSAAVSGTLKDNDVFSCVRAIAQKWTFPPPTGGDCAVVQVPFQFAPKGG